MRGGCAIAIALFREPKLLIGPTKRPTALDVTIQARSSTFLAHEAASGATCDGILIQPDSAVVAGATEQRSTYVMPAASFDAGAPEAAFCQPHEHAHTPRRCWRRSTRSIRRAHACPR